MSKKESGAPKGKDQACDNKTGKITRDILSVRNVPSYLEAYNSTRMVAEAIANAAKLYDSVGMTSKMLDSSKMMAEAIANSQKIYDSASMASKMMEIMNTRALSDDYFNKIKNISNRYNETNIKRFDALEKLHELERALDTKDTQLGDKHKQYEKLLKEYEEANKKHEKEIDLVSLLSQVTKDAHDLIMTDENFKNKFDTSSPCNAVVLSIDIRRSTELMLKAKDASSFERFITDLCNGLTCIIKNNFGVFDKFTGDGILAFFPDFFSGEDAAIAALNSAVDCHNFFDGFYKQSRGLFSSVLADVGLGIGVDFGCVHIVKMHNYTVIGSPVVYACRMSGAPAKTTYLNHPAYEELISKYDEKVKFEETLLDIKHEGNTVAYKLICISQDIVLNKPDWLKK